MEYIVQTDELELACHNVPSFHFSNSEIEIKQYGNHVKFVLCEAMGERLCSVSLVVADSSSHEIKKFYTYCTVKRIIIYLKRKGVIY